MNEDSPVGEVSRKGLAGWELNLKEATAGNVPWNSLQITDVFSFFLKPRISQSQ